MTAVVKEKSEFSLFVRREIDDYGLDPYEFRIYARITRRAGNGEAWESLANMASACCMSLGRARRALHLLKLAKLVESIERPGYSTLYRLTPQYKWVECERLQELRSFINLRATKSPTPITSDRGTKNDSPITSSSTPLSDVIPLPLSDVKGEGIPSESISLKVLPQSPLTPQGEKRGEGEEIKSNRQVLELSQQLAHCLTDALRPVFASFVAETKSVLLEIKERSLLAVSSDKTKLPKQRSTKSVPPLDTDLAFSTSYEVRTQKSGGLEGYSQLLDELARIIDESAEDLRCNSNLTNALIQNPSSIEPAMQYFKQALATWKKKPGLGLFISALKKGLKPCPTKPGGGWGEWANEAMKRRLMQFSQSHDGDIMVYFVGGIQKLWSEVRHLDWAEIEAMVALSSHEPRSA